MLENLKPERVFHYFEELTKIPRESGNEQAVSDFLYKTGKEPVSYTHLTLPTTRLVCRSRWSPYH